MYKLNMNHSKIIILFVFNQNMDLMGYNYYNIIRQNNYHKLIFSKLTPFIVIKERGRGEFRSIAGDDCK